MGLLAVDVGERADAGRRRARIRGGRGCASRGNRAWIRSMRGRAWCPLSSGVIGWVQLRASDDQTARRDVSGRHGSGGPSGACYPLVSKRGGNDARKRVLNTSETRCANKGARHGLRWAEDRRRQGVAMHSPFEGMTAEETFNSHKATLRGLQDTGHPHNGCARCGGDLGRRARMDVAVRRRARGHPRDGFSLPAPHGARDGAAARRSLAGCGRRQIPCGARDGFSRAHAPSLDAAPRSSLSSPSATTSMGSTARRSSASRA